MSVPTPLEESPPHPSDDGDLPDRIHRLEGELAELRHTLSELAEIVVGDIKERRDAAAAVSAPLPEEPVPGQAALTAIIAPRRPWLLTEFFREVGGVVRMYMDARYRLRRSTQMMVPLFVGLIAANYLFFFHLLIQIPVVTAVVEHAVAIVLAVLLYKVLSREVLRYRQMLANLALMPRTWKPVPASLLNTDPDTAPLNRQEGSG
jgi:hypothetical protein